MEARLDHLQVEIEFLRDTELPENVTRESRQKEGISMLMDGTDGRSCGLWGGKSSTST